MAEVLKRFTIHDAGDKRDSPDVHGLEIEQTTEGFQLVQPYRVLAKATLVNMDPEPGKPIIRFHVPRFKKFDWDIDVTAMDFNSHPEKMSGKWRNNDTSNPSPPDEEDNWVATGSGRGAEGDDEARSASATY